jgi:hypothetical protein
MGPDAFKVIIARIARVSYGEARARRDDLELANRLLSSSPPHLSPAEHVAWIAPYPNLLPSSVCSKLYDKNVVGPDYSFLGWGWNSMRALLEAGREIPSVTPIAYK